MIPRRVSFLVALCAAAFLVACGSDSGGGSAGPCEGDDPPAACGATCNSLTPCEAGYFCGSDGTCTAECTVGGDQCGDGEECSADGRCESGGGNDDDGDGDGSNDDGDDGGDDEDCPAVEVNLTALIPDVMLLLDQSGSMDDPFGDTIRWEAMRDALFGPNGGQNDDGVIFQLQGSLNMGATLYTNDGQDTCPDLTTTPLALNNAQAIEQMLAPPTGPSADTPTGESVDGVVANFPDNGNPRVIVLATDGLPDTCAVPNPETEESQAVAETAVANGFTAGITTFALSIGPDVTLDHLQRLANAGQGIDLDVLPPAAAPVFRANNPADLVTAFEAIVGGIRSCEVEVEGEVDLDRADEGTVTLNGDELEYGTDWEMVDESTLTLLGAACETFKATADVALSAEFPCGVVIDVD